LEEVKTEEREMKAEDRRREWLPVDINSGHLETVDALAGCRLIG
jgi:hypothetical protein